MAPPVGEREGVGTMMSRTNTAAIATLLPPLRSSCPQAAASATVTFFFIVIIIATAAITVLPLFCHRRHTAVDTLPRHCKIGRSLKSRSNSSALEKPPMAFHVHGRGGNGVILEQRCHHQCRVLRMALRHTPPCCCHAFRCTAAATDATLPPRWPLSPPSWPLTPCSDEDRNSGGNSVGGNGGGDSGGGSAVCYCDRHPLPPTGPCTAEGALQCDHCAQECCLTTTTAGVARASSWSNNVITDPCKTAAQRRQQRGPRWPHLGATMLSPTPSAEGGAVQAEAGPTVAAGRS